MWYLPRPGLEPISPCIGRQILNHCAAREAPCFCLKLINCFSVWSSPMRCAVSLIRNFVPVSAVFASLKHSCFQTGGRARAMVLRASGPGRTRLGFLVYHPSRAAPTPAPGTQISLQDRSPLSAPPRPWPREITPTSCPQLRPRTLATHPTPADARKPRSRAARGG